MRSVPSVEAHDVANGEVSAHPGSIPEGDPPPSSERFPNPAASSLEEQRLDRSLLGMRGCNGLTPQQIEHYQRAFDAMPKQGDDFLGFRLVSEIGHGTFGRVFLAAQSELANRLVALKISPDVGAESNRLARLRHTNVVPIHSVYLKGHLQALCMPYLGSNTLLNLIAELRSLRLGSTEPRPLVQEFFSSRGLGEIDGILTVMAKLAKGLAHAHGRKILHCDLKPANVLLSDDGEPMLLDFNLSVNAIHVTNTAFVGTFPYMSPEQLLCYFDEGPGIDERSDLYSLGVILFKLLTGEDRFANPALPSIDEQVRQMIVDRHSPTPPANRWNPKVPPSVQSILDRLLAPAPDDRYQSADELRDDLQRHLRRRRLKHAPDRSWREAWSRFRYRNPRLTSVVSLSLLTVALVVLLWTGLAAASKELARSNAREAARQFQDQRREVAFFLTGRTASDRAELGLRESEAALAKLPPATIQLLPEADRSLAREGIAEVLYLRAVGHKLKASRLPLPSREVELTSAEATLDRLSDAGEGVRLQRAVATLRADLERLRGNENEASRLERSAEGLQPESSHDLYLSAFAPFEKGDYPKAISALTRSLRGDPTNLHAWSMLGICHESRGELGEAAWIFTTCILLRPEYYAGHYLRGKTYVKLGRNEEAKLDLTEAIRIRPDFADAYLNRSLALSKLGELEEAERDLTRVIDLEPGRGRAYLLRARVRHRRNDPGGAKDDRETGIGLPPAEPVDWVTRGQARLPADPDGALADFDAAIRLDPRYLPAFQNKAALLADFLMRPDESIRVLDAALELFPNDWVAHAGRGILLARAGRREAAIRDAEAAISLDGSPTNRYQLAGIYAQTSRQNPEDAPEAFRLLGSALRAGYGFEELGTDPDLDPIRGHPRFERTVREARESRANEREP